jgi:wyosine [tRNA(Phe)-imidazoG37] synthetase (radical SAM superfamily)
MLVDGINDHESCIKKIAEQLAVIRPDKAYLLVPTRPPAESAVKRASFESLRNAVSIIHDIAEADVECITGDEKEEGFFITDDIMNDLLSIASCIPSEKIYYDQLIKKRNADKTVITELVKQGKMIEYWYEEKKFYKKNIQNNRNG